MQKYKCHKEVHAQPMTRGDYTTYRQRFHSYTDSGGGSPQEDGYHVVYSRGTDDEYESWSPKKQFDEGYTAIT